MKIVIEKNETIQRLISDMKMTAVAETREIDTKIPIAAATFSSQHPPRQRREFLLLTYAPKECYHYRSNNAFVMCINNVKSIDLGQGSRSAHEVWTVKIRDSSLTYKEAITKIGLNCVYRILEDVHRVGNRIEVRV